MARSTLSTPHRTHPWLHLGMLLAVLPLCGCASAHYKKLKPGELKGTVTVQWMEPDRFRFIPDEADPLTFRRHDQKVIRPRSMYTDGGSIPRPLWALRNYSPWGYGPAFVIHDWLFHMQDCQKDDWQSWDLDEAAMVMSEVMKTMMESGKFKFGSKTSVYFMYRGVKSGFARRAWEDRKCVEPPETFFVEEWRPTQTITVRFGD